MDVAQVQHFVTSAMVMVPWQTRSTLQCRFDSSCPLTVLLYDPTHTNVSMRSIGFASHLALTCHRHVEPKGKGDSSQHKLSSRHDMKKELCSLSGTSNCWKQGIMLVLNKKLAMQTATTSGAWLAANILQQCPTSDDLVYQGLQQFSKSTQQSCNSSSLCLHMLHALSLHKQCKAHSKQLLAAKLAESFLSIDCTLALSFWTGSCPSVVHSTAKNIPESVGYSCWSAIAARSLVFSAS